VSRQWKCQIIKQTNSNNKQRSSSTNTG